MAPAVLTDAGSIDNDGLIIGSGAAAAPARYRTCADSLRQHRSGRDDPRSLERAGRRNDCHRFCQQPWAEPSAMRGGPMFEFCSASMLLRRQGWRDRIELVFFSVRPIVRASGWATGGRSSAG